MKYAVLKVVNGNFSVAAEGFTEEAKAIVNYHGVCQTLWNAPDVLDGAVMIVDENLRQVNGYYELIHHDAPVEVVG